MQADTSELISVIRSGDAPSAAFLSRVPHAFARRHLLLSAGERDGVELLRAAPSTSAIAVHNTGVRLGRRVETRLEAPEPLAAAIDRAYEHLAVDHAQAEPSGAATDADVEAQIREVSTASDVLDTSSKGPVVRLVDLLLFEAAHRRASDVHIQPLADRVLIRYRFDGVLHDVRVLPRVASLAVISRIKVMARMDVAEQGAPQDGRTAIRLGDRRIDLRVSTMPTTYGERIVVRLLDSAAAEGLLAFEALGMPAHVEREYLAGVSRSSGVTLVTGPTGSGKTTTLYTTLLRLSQAPSGRCDGCELNIMTLEDPVEYDLSATGLSISQTALNPKRGVTFAAGLRHMLRQDPDVIMVGEIRDEETARIAMQASLTGHLVLSTMHTNDSASAVTRLRDLGIEAYLVASALNSVLAQRLVRVVHHECRGAGCDACIGTGYRGRTGLFELLRIDDEVRAAIAGDAPCTAIKQIATRSQQMEDLATAGRRLVAAGRTTLAEFERVLDLAEAAR